MSPLPPGEHTEPRRRKAIQITLESSDALGPSTRRLANSDAIVVSFPRDALCRIADYPELRRRGVYMLIAAIPGPRPLRIYVGEAQDVLKRLQRHERDREYLPRKLTEEGSDAFGNERPGDLCYYAPWGNLAFFHAGYRWSRGLIRLGRLEGGLEPLLVRGTFPFRVERTS